MQHSAAFPRESPGYENLCPRRARDDAGLPAALRGMELRRTRARRGRRHPGPRADVQFAVYDDYGGAGNPHDLVIPVELQEDVPTFVWAGGVESFEGDAVLTRVSCQVQSNVDRAAASDRGSPAGRQRPASKWTRTWSSVRTVS